MTDYSYTPEEVESAKNEIRRQIASAFDRRLWEQEIFDQVTESLVNYNKTKGQRYIVTARAIDDLIHENEIQPVKGQTQATGRRLFEIVNVLDRLAKSV